MIICPYCSEQNEVPTKKLDKPIIAKCPVCKNLYSLRLDSSGFWVVRLKETPDIRQISGEGSIGYDLLQNYQKTLDKLPVFPRVAQQVLQIINNPECSMKEVADVVKNDQVMTMKVLRVANSALYGGFSEIVDLTTACTRLGMKNLCNAVQSAATANLFKSKNAAQEEILKKLWLHSLATGYCASQITSMIAEPGAEHYFAAGLLHDVGKLLLFRMLTSPPLEKNKLIKQSDNIFKEIIAGYFHQYLGYEVAVQWELPIEFAIGIFCHEQTQAVPDDSWLPFVHVLSLADNMAALAGFGAEECEPLPLLSHPSTKFLGLNDIKLAILRVDLEDKIMSLYDAIQ